MIRARVLLVIAAVAVGAILGVVARGEPAHLPTARYVSAAEAKDGDWQWDDQRKGTVKGRLNFSAKRPNQPIVVYLLRVEGDAKAPVQGKYTVPAKQKISQKGAKFEPSFAVLVRNQTVEFLNDEEKEISHNVYFLGDVEVDLGIFDQNESREHKFEKYGEASVHCSIHKRMDGKFFIAPNPAFALIDGDAESFEIIGVPVGTWRILTWQKQKRFKDFDATIEVKADTTTDITVEMTR